MCISNTTKGHKNQRFLWNLKEYYYYYYYYYTTSVLTAFFQGNLAKPAPER